MPLWIMSLAHSLHGKRATYICDTSIEGWDEAKRMKPDKERDQAVACYERSTANSVEKKNACKKKMNHDLPRIGPISQQSSRYVFLRPHQTPPDVGAVLVEDRVHFCVAHVLRAEGRAPRGGSGSVSVFPTLYYCCGQEPATAGKRTAGRVGCIAIESMGKMHARSLG